MFDFQPIGLRAELRQEQTVREEQNQTVIGLTHRLMNSLAELPRLSRLRKDLQFWLDDSDGDLGEMGRLARRVENNGIGLGRHRRAVRDFYPQLTRLIIDKCADGAALTSLDVFVLNLRPHLAGLIEGQRTIHELDRAYDWQNNRFPR